jgi:hypothetical protein
LYILDIPLVDDAEIIVVASSSLPRPRIIPPPARGRAVGRRCDGGGIATAAVEDEDEDEDDDVDHRDEDVPNDLEGRYSSFAQRRSRSGRERVVGRAAPAAADDGGTIGV